MSTDVEFDPLPDGPVAGQGGESKPFTADLARLTNVAVELTVEVGRTRMSLGETMALGPGSVVMLDRLADKPVDLLVNGRSIASGEVVVIDEQFGLRITEIVGVDKSDEEDRMPSTPGLSPSGGEAVSVVSGAGLTPDFAAAATPGDEDVVMDSDAIASLFEGESDDSDDSGSVDGISFEL